jgi:hypothetical protein
LGDPSSSSNLVELSLSLLETAPLRARSKRLSGWDYFGLRPARVMDINLLLALQRGQDAYCRGCNSQLISFTSYLKQTAASSDFMKQRPS